MFKLITCDRNYENALQYDGTSIQDCREALIQLMENKKRGFIYGIFDQANKLIEMDIAIYINKAVNVS